MVDLPHWRSAGPFQPVLFLGTLIHGSSTAHLLPYNRGTQTSTLQSDHQFHAFKACWDTKRIFAGGASGFVTKSRMLLNMHLFGQFCFINLVRLADSKKAKQILHCNPSFLAEQLPRMPCDITCSSMYNIQVESIPDADCLSQTLFIHGSDMPNIYKCLRWTAALICCIAAVGKSPPVKKLSICRRWLLRRLSTSAAPRNDLNGWWGDDLCARLDTRCKQPQGQETQIVQVNSMPKWRAVQMNLDLVASKFNFTTRWTCELKFNQVAEVSHLHVIEEMDHRSHHHLCPSYRHVVLVFFLTKSGMTCQHELLEAGLSKDNRHSQGHRLLLSAHPPHLETAGPLSKKMLREWGLNMSHFPGLASSPEAGSSRERAFFFGAIIVTTESIPGNYYQCITAQLQTALWKLSYKSGTNVKDMWKLQISFLGRHECIRVPQPGAAKHAEVCRSVLNMPKCCTKPNKFAALKN